MSVTSPSSLDGFDPLSEKLDASNLDLSPFEAATQRAVLNILKSYTGYFDVFSELIQNALDAIDARKRRGDSFSPKISLEINIPEGLVIASDNGIGMDENELRFCFRPSVSFKTRREARGHKGVGATFLAYGFESISIWTNQGARTLAVRLPNGRVWAEGTQTYGSRPTLQDISSEESPFPQQPGTTVKIVVGKANRPDLTWWGASSADQWLEILRIKTPLGGIYLKGEDLAQRHVEVIVTDNAGKRTQAETRRAEYLYPHDLPTFSQRTKTVSEARVATQNCFGDSSKIPADCKNLSALCEIWTADDILKDEDSYWSGCFNESEKRLLVQHDVAVYAFFASSAKGWTEYQVDHLKIRKAPVLLKGGYQIASDCMVQGDLNVIPLTSTIGYQANTHIVIHFKDGNPDMGRKVFQPEIKELAEKCSRQCVNIFKRFLYLLREDTGAPTFEESGELYEWLKAQERHAEAAPLPQRIGHAGVFFESEPQTEQDVIALFHQLVGSGFFRGYRFFAISQFLRYDGCFRTDYQSFSDMEYSISNHLGVSSRVSQGKKSKPFVLEFKSDLDSLIADFEKESKCLADIDLLVCWSVGKAVSNRFRVRSYLVGNEGSARRFYGATHAVYLEKVLQFEVVCLADVFGYYTSPEVVIAAHTVAYDH